MMARNVAAPTAAPAVRCATCGSEVPAGVFCGHCGAHLHVTADAGRHRSHAFALAPGEHLLHVSFVSTLFPQLPHRARAPFRAAAIAVTAVLVVLALVRLQAPLVAVAALGLPLLFLLYLYEVDVHEDYHWAESLLVLGGGAALGAVYAALTGPVVTHALSGSFTGGVTHRSLGVAGVVIPAGAQLLMLVPAGLFWLRRTHRNEAMDGFVVGAAGALGFVLTATLTRLWPQLSSGVVADHRPLTSIVTEGVLQGVTVPVVAACASALVAATVWVRRRESVHGGRWATSPVLALLAAVAVQAGLGVADIWQPGDATLLALHAVAAALLLLLLRVALHFVVLHEHHEVGEAGPPAVCAHCHHLVPTMPFCPHCGHARRGSSRTLRAALAVSDAGAEPGA